MTMRCRVISSDTQRKDALPRGRQAEQGTSRGSLFGFSSDSGIAKGSSEIKEQALTDRENVLSQSAVTLLRCSAAFAALELGLPSLAA